MPASKDWQHRYDAIRAILGSRNMGSQAELCKSLRAKGFKVTQSSVSRDLAELHAAKVDGRYVLPESLAAQEPAGPQLERSASDILSVQPAGPHLLVVRTPPGRASALGLALDTAGWPELVGTVAGDDTVFLAVAGRRNQVAVEARLALARKNPHR